ncbi:ATP-binding protein [Streptomyces sp. NPDC002990]
MEDVLLLVSEVVTNACLHAGGPRELVLRHSAERLRVEVSDDSPEPPRRRPPGDRTQPGGHGLIVLERLSRSWGSVPSGGGRPGKTVWLEVAAPGRRLPERPPGPAPEPTRGPGLEPTRGQAPAAAPGPPAGSPAGWNPEARGPRR